MIIDILSFNENVSNFTVVFYFPIFQPLSHVSVLCLFSLYLCFHSIYVYLEGRFWENSELIFFWAWKIKARSAGGLEELNPGNPQSTGEGEDEHKHTLITNQVEEANVHLLKSAEIGVGVPEVLYATSICKCQGTSTSS